VKDLRALERLILEKTLRSLLEIYRAVFIRFPECWIGVNCLDLAPQEVFYRITKRGPGSGWKTP